jgi:cytochrome d ubiquinol oxidase subunit I
VTFPTPTKWFLPAAAVAGPAAVITMEAGWVVTEVSAQSEEAVG